MCRQIKREKRGKEKFIFPCRIKAQPCILDTTLHKPEEGRTISGLPASYCSTLTGPGAGSGKETGSEVLWLGKDCSDCSYSMSQWSNQSRMSQSQLRSWCFLPYIKDEILKKLFLQQSTRWMIFNHGETSQAKGVWRNVSWGTGSIFSFTTVSSSLFVLGGGSLSN